MSQKKKSEISRLQTTLDHQTNSAAGISTIYPSDSVLHAANPPPARSVVSTTEAQPPQPRPDQYPFEILWEFDDCKKDEDAGLTAQNPAQPAMERAVRHADGTMISSKEWTAIKATTRKRSQNYYQSAYPAQWAAIIQEMEQQQPLLTLCSNHWKAEHVLGQMLRSSKLVDEVAISNNDEDATLIAIPSGTGTGTGTGAEAQKQRRARSSVSETAKKQRPVSSTAPKAMSEVQMRMDNSSSDTLMPPPTTGQFSVPIQKSLPPPSFLSVSSNKGSKKYNVDFIEVSSSILDLKTIITRNFDSNSFGINLFDAMELSTDFSPGPPSSLMLEFIERIERADPNSPEFDEDDHGNCETARRLIAATIKTCKVARHICFQEKILSLTFLADNYLNNILKQIWAAWKAAGGPVSKGKASSTVSMTSASVSFISAATEPPSSVLSASALTFLASVATSVSSMEQSTVGGSDLASKDNCRAGLQFTDLVAVILALPIKKQPSEVEVESIMSKASHPLYLLLNY
ncbi:hypothetical protein SERLADRAFT_439911 [Serpula lacrymans var. lacrymans S7.9]|uniref:Uncharacterized protein n=1 Tax=Serpula lacrymans var. lacrymans (strain S7.9) TaxID=578457 RepID=F8P1Z3_SERL9|nr:uncharacterized protein SERLADRAFT_439911 [Serpula lacrymans var. lacrymans S7.9]EGO23171.1 hypothetical protein SERLADRAFT_439911 [Serpula lacrymans var. lacrymans S7.9]